LADYDPGKMKRLYKMNIYDFMKMLCFKKYSGFIEALYFKRKKNLPATE